VFTNILYLASFDSYAHFRLHSEEHSLDDVFTLYKPKAVIHFAGLKAVGQSVKEPLLYYKTNLTSTLSLLNCMRKHDVNTIIFSSSATVYGISNPSPYKEDMPTGNVSNPYGRTKYMIEEILKDLQTANPLMSVSILRYFNPVGAHSSGLIGEDPNGIPNNLMPFIEKVVKGEIAELQIFGSDYDTHDGTGVRDYIHVTDLAVGHVKALQVKLDKPGTHIYNLGTGNGVSVMDMVNSYKKTSGVDIPYTIVDRRPGDLPAYYADASKAMKELGWQAEKSIDDMTKDSWNWVQNSSN
jgi:UDP-glucose 4-epimerase